MRLRQVVGPTARERAEHDRFHLLCRPWCPVCVADRSVDHGHKTVRDERGEQAPEVSFDYCFLRDLPGGDHFPVLVGCDTASRSIIAHAVPYKGADASWTAQQRFETSWGYHGRFTFQTDQELALKSFMNEVATSGGSLGMGKLSG